jgi:hypothetical protein
MASTRHGRLRTLPETRKRLQGRSARARQLCRVRPQMWLDEAAGKCAQTRVETEIEPKLSARLDCRAAMLQAISIGREIPMLEPWIINEIRRREEERRRGDLPRLEIPLPQPPGPDGGDVDGGQDRQGDQSPERGVVIIGM